MKSETSINNSMLLTLLTAYCIAAKFGRGKLGEFGKLSVTHQT